MSTLVFGGHSRHKFIIAGSEQAIESGGHSLHFHRRCTAGEGTRRRSLF
jgi:hypothetical protein